MSSGWIAVDLDGTLAHYDGWRGFGHIGEPVPVMLERVMRWIAQGKDIRIFTARIADRSVGREAKAVVEAWCLKHVGQVLPVTNVKDMGMGELWDARAVQGRTTTGERVG